MLAALERLDVLARVLDLQAVRGAVMLADCLVLRFALAFTRGPPRDGA